MKEKQTVQYHVQYYVGGRWFQPPNQGNPRTPAGVRQYILSAARLNMVWGFGRYRVVRTTVTHEVWGKREWEKDPSNRRRKS